MLIALFGGVGLFYACGQDLGGPQAPAGAGCPAHGAGCPARCAGDHVPLFTQTSFDGCWNWYEEGKRLYKVTIARGEVVSFQPLNQPDSPRGGSDSPRGGPDTRPTGSTATCAIDSQDGLIAISSTERAGNSRRTIVTTLRFDLSDPPNRTARAAGRSARAVGRSARAVGRSGRDGLRTGFIAEGGIAGRRTVEHNNDDHFLFPPHEHKRGRLVRCD